MGAGDTATTGQVKPERILLMHKIRPLFSTQEELITPGTKVVVTQQSSSSYSLEQGEVVGFIESLGKFVVKFGEGEVDALNATELLIVP